MKLAHLALLVATLTVALACQRAAPAHLIQVTGVSSERIAEGDVLELRGIGFPEGRPARVTLRGAVFRPGRPAEHGFELVLPARSTSPHSLAVDVSREVEQAFVGLESRHATFRGAIEVAFFPLSTSMPPVTGALPGAILDVVRVSAVSEALLDEARRFAEFSGVLLSREAPLLVEGVMPGSRAERAGLVRGDRLAELAGLRLLALDDLVPPPRVKRVKLAVRRPRVSGAVHSILDVDGFHRLAPRDLAGGVGVVAAVLALFALLRSPLGAALSFLELRWVAALRERRELAKLRELERAPRGTESFLIIALPRTAGAYVALAVSAGALMFLGVGGVVLAAEVDLAVLAFASVVATAAAALLFGAPGERGLVARVRRAFLALLQGVPLLAALACALVASGSLVLDDVGRAQGPFPWQWHALKSPILLAAALSAFVSLVPEATRGDRDRLSPSDGAATSRVPELVGWSHLVLGSGLLVAGLLGGPYVPAVGSLAEAPLGTVVLSACLLIGKTMVVVTFVIVLRALLRRVDVREAAGLTARLLVPVSLLACGASLLLQRGEIRAAVTAASATLGVGCFVGVALLAVWFARRVSAGAIGRDVDPGVNPWL